MTRNTYEVDDPDGMSRCEVHELVARGGAYFLTFRAGGEGPPARTTCNVTTRAGVGKSSEADASSTLNNRLDGPIIPGGFDLTDDELNWAIESGRIEHHICDGSLVTFWRRP